MTLVFALISVASTAAFAARAPSFQLLRTGSTPFVPAIFDTRSCSSFQAQSEVTGLLLTCTAFHCLHGLRNDPVALFHRARVVVPGIPHRWQQSANVRSTVFTQMPHHDISCTTAVPSFDLAMKLMTKVPPPGTPVFSAGYPKGVGPELATCTYQGRAIRGTSPEDEKSGLILPLRLVGILECGTDVTNGYSGAAVYTDDGILGVLSAGRKIAGKTIVTVELLAESPLATGRARAVEEIDDLLHFQDGLSKGRVIYQANGLLDRLEALHANGAKHIYVFTPDARSYNFETYNSAGERY